MKHDRKTAEKLIRLKTVADVVFQTDMARVVAASATVTGLETQISKLREQLNAPISGQIDPHVFQITAKHRVWVEQSIRGLNIKLARAIAERDVERLALANSSGRKEVLAGLVDKFSRNSVE